MRQLALLFSLLLVLLAAAPAGGATEPAVSVWLDGRPLALDPPPVIVSGRTLVPLRGAAEALGAAVGWEATTRAITIAKGAGFAELRIDRRLLCLDRACNRAELQDVPPAIRADRTFVPVRSLAAALQVGVTWDGVGRRVLIDSPAPVTPPDRAVRISGVDPGAVIHEPASLRAEWQVGAAARIRWYLLDRQTGAGPLLAQADDPAAPLTWLPDAAYGGKRLLAAARNRADGRFLAADVVPVEVAIAGSIAWRGLAAEQHIAGPTALAVDVGFVATSVRYERVDPATAQRVLLAEIDPYSAWTWQPTTADNGRWLLAATAADRAGNSHAVSVPVVVDITPSSLLTGITPEAVIDGPVNLRLQVNYPVKSVQFVLADGRVLAAGANPAASYRWFPGPEFNGRREISAIIYLPDDQVRYAPAIPVQVTMSPQVRLTTVGRNQVIGTSQTLRSEGNLPFDQIEYRLIDPATDKYRVVASGRDAGTALTWRPVGLDGNWVLQSVATGPGGAVAYSSRVPIRIYTGPTYAKRPLEGKEAYLERVKALAVASRRSTGMSAALQVAQAIHETGWGQSIGVDKYTGQFSYALFGIKGEGPAGSVIMTTWESIGGIAVTIDDRFRAYHNVEESWQDHKDFLLKRDRYAPFRAVMVDGVQGAWALWRSGYATDPGYAPKLIDLMQRLNLQELDAEQP